MADYFSMINLTFILLLIAIHIIIYIKKIYNLYKYPFIKDKISNATLEIFVQYLDKYYITKKYYTAFSVMLYFIGNIGIVLYLRIFINKHKATGSSVYPIDVTYVPMELSFYYTMLFSLILFILVIISYKRMLNDMFFIEVLKSHIYLYENQYYATIKRCFDVFAFKQKICKMYLVLFNIAALREYIPEKDDFTNAENIWYGFDSSKDVYQNKHVYALSVLLTNVAHKYKLFRLLMLLSSKILHVILYLFAEKRFMFYIPYIIYFSVVFYDFIHLKFYYAYYAFFPFYIITLIMSLILFLDDKDGIKDYNIYQYFYKNGVDYARQRCTFGTNIYLDIINISKQNRNLFKKFYNETHLQEYVMKDLYTVSITDNPDQKAFIIKGRASVKRYYVLCLLFICTMYTIIHSTNYTLNLFGIKVSLGLIMVLLYTILTHCIINIFKSAPNNIDDDPIKYKYNKYYHMLYWILLSPILFMLYLLLIKDTLFLITDGILWQYENIKVIRFYAMEDKIVFFYKYLHQFIQLNNISDKITTIIMTFIKETDVISLIDQEMTLDEIKKLVNDIFEHYNGIVHNLNELILKANEAHLTETNAYQKKIDKINHMIHVILSVILVTCLYIKLPMFILLLSGKYFLVPLIRLRCNELAVDTTLFSDEFIWEIAKIVIKHEYSFTFIYQLIKYKLGI